MLEKTTGIDELSDDEPATEPRCAHELDDDELDAVAGGGLVRRSCPGTNLKI